MTTTHGRSLEGVWQPGVGPLSHRPPCSPQDRSSDAPNHEGSLPHLEPGERPLNHGAPVPRPGPPARYQLIYVTCSLPPAPATCNPLGGQPSAALRATSGQDRPASARAHTGPEAVGLRTTAIIRLEGPLHGAAPAAEVWIARLQAKRSTIRNQPFGVKCTTAVNVRDSHHSRTRRTCPPERRPILSTGYEPSEIPGDKPPTAVPMDHDLVIHIPTCFGG